jgi:hypothetical protein
MAFNGLTMGLGAVLVFLGLLAFSRTGLPLAAGSFVFIVGFVLFRLGMGLPAGERQAVYGLCVLSGFEFLLRIFFLVRGEVYYGMTLLVSIPVLYVPPTVSAFRHWRAFKPSQNLLARRTRPWLFCRRSLYSIYWDAAIAHICSAMMSCTA